MPLERLACFVLLPELNLVGHRRLGKASNIYFAEKIRAPFEVCPKCATPSKSLYDKRWVTLKDEPVRGVQMTLRVRKSRYYCKTCRKPFTEPLQGVMPKRKTTQRFRRSLLWACQTFGDLSKVRRHYRVSSALLYKILFEQLELKLRQQTYPWPEKIGIDEHFFSRHKGYREFATVFTDQTNRRLKEIALGKSADEIKSQLDHIEGRENVKLITLDMSDSYRNFALNYFPNAKLIADKFHVLRLLTPHIMRKRREITGTNADRKARRYLLMSSKNLDYFDRKAIWNYLEQHPELKELYHWKESLHGFYRIRGYNRAARTLELMIQSMKTSHLKEIKRLGNTLEKWKHEVLNYFMYRLTNARTEGFNNVAKLVQKRAYGYKSFRNYRLRLLSACA